MMEEARPIKVLIAARGTFCAVVASLVSATHHSGSLNTSQAATAG